MRKISTEHKTAKITLSKTKLIVNIAQWEAIRIISKSSVKKTTSLSGN